MALEYVEISSKYTKKRDTLDRERLAHIKHMKRRRNHPKRHSTNGERSCADRAKYVKAERKKRAHAQHIAAFLVATKAYWNGEA